MSSTANLLEIKEELDLILETLKTLPENNKVLRSVNDRLIPHTVKETVPAIEAQLTVVKDALNQKS